MTSRTRILVRAIVLLMIVIAFSVARVPEVVANQADQKDARQSVIVIMKNSLLTGAAAAQDQEPLMSELHDAKATQVKAYRLVNALAATVSSDEVARLKKNPSVAQVIPDSLIYRKAREPRESKPLGHAGSASGTGTSPALHTIPGACGEGGRVLLDPEALQTTNTNSDDPLAPTARSLGLTGAGVKVAWIADGVDPQNVNFIRADGTSAFSDYQDFSGDGPSAVTDGGEAFLDSNAIGGQGIHVYDVSHFGAQADPSVCDIRIEGMAPGASMVGLKIFSQANYSSTSGILQAVDYAVMTAHVDILNESLGGNYFPDVTAQDVFKQFNDAAIRAGVTVTASSGDSGSTNTIISPSSDPLVISVGGSTTFRFYAQTNYGAARYFATSGWLSDNVSSLSSGGFTETGNTVSLVAPADLGFASCDASPNFQACVDDLGNVSSVEESGGTSLSAPLTAGAAALVIEAYRRSHAGASPTPAKIKQILTSTATDLGVPAEEQGAGLLNSYKAVLLAQSIDHGRVFAGPGLSASSSASSSAPSLAPSLAKDATIGLPLLFSSNQLNGLGAPGTTYQWPVTVTNTTAIAQFVHAKGRTFGPLENVQTDSVILNDATSTQFVNYGGLTNNYSTFTFTVPVGSDRLNASLAYPGNPANGYNARVRLSLIDPRGRLAAHSLPQGVGNFGNVDVRKPTAGTWTGVIFGDVAAVGGTNGTVPWQVSTQRFVRFGSVSHSRFFLLPGEHRTLQVTAQAPMTPGDSAGSIVVSSWAGGIDESAGIERNSIAVTLRSLIDLAGGGAFSGVLTGGNGRAGGQGEINYFQFHVDPGHTSITANISLTNDAGILVGANLVNPDGAAVGFAQNTLNGVNTLALTANTLNPVPGDWTLILDFSSPVVGDEISQLFTGNIQLDQVSALLLVHLFATVLRR